MSILRKKDKGGGMMERLTERQSSGFDLTAMNGEYCNRYCEQQRVETCNECGIYQAIQKLAEYEDLEEQDLLLRLPCKVGDTVYSIANDCKIYPVKATREVRIVNGVLHILCESCRYSDLVSYNDIGKTVFLTQAEAEQKLKEMESD